MRRAHRLSSSTECSRTSPLAFPTDVASCSATASPPLTSPVAALAAPVLLPERYGSPLPAPTLMPGAVAREVDRLRNHPAGAFAERLYREERGRGSSPAPA